jgi:PAS domain S-box-containing protein/excisionase family DNA binding protein
MQSTSRSLFDELPATTGIASLDPFEATTGLLRLYRRAIERSDIPIGVAALAAEGVGDILECNTAFEWLLGGSRGGGSREALIGTPWIELTAPEDREAELAALRGLIADGLEIDKVERRYTRLDGATVWTSASVALLHDTEEKPAAVVFKLVDVSARKAYEAERDASSDYHEARAAARTAIHDQIELMYEPVFDLESGHIIAIDAIGPCHPDHLRLSPNRLVAIADDLDLGVELGLWMLARACTRLVQLGPPAREAVPPRMIVRLPAQLVTDERLAERVLSVIAASGTDASKLTLEVEEQDLNDAPAFVERELRRLGGAGLRIYIGHFGDTVTSLARLRSIPVDGLKLAGEIVGRIGAKRDARLAAAVVALGRAAEIEVVAEDVSSADQLHALQELGCPAGKGPFLSTPVRGQALVGTLDREPELLRLPRTPAIESSGPPHIGPTLPLGAAADALHISPSTLRRWADDGRIMSVRTVGGHRRIPVSEVHRHLKPDAFGPRPELRDEPSINSAEPVLADLLDRHGIGLAERVPRDMYGATPGWFARSAAAGDLRRWVVGVSEAVRAGDQVLLTVACARLAERAVAGGALLIEILKYIALFFRAAEFALSRMDVAPEIVLDLHRVAAAARQSVLFDVDGHR